MPQKTILSLYSTIRITAHCGVFSHTLNAPHISSLLEAAKASEIAEKAFEAAGRASKAAGRTTEVAGMAFVAAWRALGERNGCNSNTLCPAAHILGT